MASSKLTTLQALQRIDRPVFTTREIAALRRASIAAVSLGLQRRADEGLILRAARGVWCAPRDRRFTPYLLVPLLAGREEAYVSFLSALHLHGVIEQIPEIIYAATTAHTRTVRTPVGTFSYHQLDASLFDGFEWQGHGEPFPLATMEKALVDCIYVSSRRGKRFAHLPEIELGRGFSRRRARDWVRRIADPRIRAYASGRLAELLGEG